MITDENPEEELRLELGAKSFREAVQREQVRRIGE